MDYPRIGLHLSSCEPFLILSKFMFHLERLHTLGIYSGREYPPSSVLARVGVQSRLGEEQGDRQGEGPPGTAQATGTGALPDRSSGGLRRTKRRETRIKLVYEVDTERP